MTVDLFAGVPVSDFRRAVDWYGRLFGAEPSSFPHDTEAVWELEEHRYLYVVEQPEGAGHAVHTLFVGDLDERIEAMSGRGLEPAEDETYDNGVRKVTYRDPDGNETGFGGESGKP